VAQHQARRRGAAGDVKPAGLKGSRAEVEAAHAVRGELHERLGRELAHVKESEPGHARLHEVLEAAHQSLAGKTHDAAWVLKAHQGKDARQLLVDEAARLHPDEVAVPTGKGVARPEGVLMRDPQSGRVEARGKAGSWLSTPSHQEMGRGAVSQRMQDAGDAIARLRKDGGKPSEMAAAAAGALIEP
jgi:hypothetical protein